MLQNEEKFDNLLSSLQKNVNALCGVDRVLPGVPMGKTYENTRPGGPLESFEATYYYTVRALYTVLNIYGCYEYVCLYLTTPTSPNSKK